MAENEEKTIVDSITNDDTIKELETLGTKIHDIIKSDDYKKFLKITEDLNKNNGVNEKVISEITGRF